MNATASSLDTAAAEHRQILARFFLDSHLDDVPEEIEWPRVAPEVLDKLRGLTL